MKRASYFVGDKAVQGVVVEENQGPDGLVVDLSADGKKKPFVRRAPVSASAQPGHAVLTGEAEPEGDKKPEGDK